MGFEFHSNDEKLRFIAKEIDSTEKQMLALRRVLGGYVRNQNRLAKKSYKFATVLDRFADTEAPELSDMLSNIAEKFKERERLRESMACRITRMTQEPLAIYDKMCGKVKKELKTREVVREKFAQKQNLLDKVIVNESGNRAKINQSQMELSAASQDVHHTTNQLVDSVNRFEVLKRRDLKTCLSDLVWNEMSFHAKALEGLTKLHADINMRELENDLDEIQVRISLASRPTSRGNSPVRTRHSTVESPEKRSQIESPRKSRVTESPRGSRGTLAESPKKV